MATVDANDPSAVLGLADSWRADLTVVGPEAPLAAGVADRFLDAGRPLFGPTRGAAQLETSKAFAKDVMVACRGADGPRPHLRLVRTCDGRGARW